MEVALLVMAHNCKQKVLSCLEECLRQIDSLAGDGKYTFTIYFRDDASQDGTLEAVQEHFDKVIASTSRSRSYMNGTLRAIWEQAAQKDPDFYIWIDARIALKDNAIATLLENSAFLSHNAIITGSITDADGVVTRGGRTKKGKISEPDPIIPIPTFTFDGNILLVPASAFKILGMTSAKRKDYLGDWEYGLKAYQNDIPRVIAPGILGSYDTLLRSKESQRDRFAYDLASNGPFFATRNFFQRLFKSAFTIKKQN